MRACHPGFTLHLPPSRTHMAGRHQHRGRPLPPEFHSMRFRQPQDYLLMLLVMTSCLALGRRRSRDLFQISLLVVCAAISFRLQRDTWLVTLVAAGIIGRASPTGAPEEQPAWHWGRLLTTALVLVTLAAGTLRLPTRNGVLMAKVGDNFPDARQRLHTPEPSSSASIQQLLLGWFSDLVLARISRGH